MPQSERTVKAWFLSLKTLSEERHIQTTGFCFNFILFFLNWILFYLLRQEHELWLKTGLYDYKRYSYSESPVPWLSLSSNIIHSVRSLILSSFQCQALALSKNGQKSVAWWIFTHMLCEYWRKGNVENHIYTRVQLASK